MNNLDFVKKLISGTKTGSVEWENASSFIINKYSTFDSIFCFMRQKYEVLIAKMDKDNPSNLYNENKYALFIVDGTSFEEIFCIDSDNLMEGDIYSNSFSPEKNDSSALSRLYRLAERSSKKIDRLFDVLTQGINDEDELPF